MRKIVASRSPLEFTWRNSEQLQGDLVEAVTALKDDPAIRRIALSGSVSVVRQLLDAGLLDELHLFVHPATAGSGLQAVRRRRPGATPQAGLGAAVRDRRGAPRVRDPTRTRRRARTRRRGRACPRTEPGPGSARTTQLLRGTASRSWSWSGRRRGRGGGRRRGRRGRVVVVVVVGCSRSWSSGDGRGGGRGRGRCRRRRCAAGDPEDLVLHVGTLRALGVDGQLHVPALDGCGSMPDRSSVYVSDASRPDSEPPPLLSSSPMETESVSSTTTAPSGGAPRTSRRRTGRPRRSRRSRPGTCSPRGARCSDGRRTPRRRA